MIVVTNNIIRHNYIFTIILFIGVNLHAQVDFTTESRKAISMYRDAEAQLNIGQNAQAIDLLYKAIDADEKFIEAYMLLADIYDLMAKPDKVIECSQKALAINNSKYPVIYFYYTSALYQTGQYEKTKEIAQLATSKNYFTANQQKAVNKILKNCDFAINAIQHPVPFSPINLGKNVNTAYDEYWPSLSADEQMLVITRLIPKNENQPIGRYNQQEDFFTSINDNGAWQPSQNMGAPINSISNEGAQTISVDGQRMFFTACERADSKGKCDIYYSQRQGDKWSVPVNVGEPLNTPYSEKQPSLSSDGRTLYYVSNRPDGKGKFDIWMCSLTPEGKWTPPVNLGDSINTPDDEQSPYIHPDNQTLYFASDGWPGMGGLDLFYTHRKSENTWTTPQNMGYPINTSAHEMGLIINSTGNHAYFASNREPENGKDIYEFELYEKARPLEVTYMKGRVFDAETSQPLAARFELIDLKNDKTVTEARSSKTSGEFLVCIPNGCDYALNVSKKGYLFFSENFTLSEINQKTTPYLIDVPLQAIKPGSKAVLKNIFYKTGSYELKTESTTELNKLVQFLVDNAEISIEVSGHTDNTGSDAVNQKLSENRAKEVSNYLIAKGISATRIISKGYGKLQAVADNTTDEGKAKNRRTEFKIIAIPK